MLALLILLTACSTETEPATATTFAMDTVMTITVYGDNELLSVCQSRIRELEALLSVTDESSEIYALNRDGSAVLSEETGELLGTALSLCERTDGALDISIYPVIRAWGFTTDSYRVPSGTELAELLALVGYENISYDPDTLTANLANGASLDLGSVAKGYTGDVLSALLKENGVTSALLNLGGNVQAVGSKPDGSDFRVGIQDPQSSGEYFGVVNVSDKAVVTSGGYERYFEQDGEVYWHIIDPETGYPAKNGLISVTIVGNSGTVCDALSTALFVMGLDSAAKFWRGSDDFEAIFVSDDGSIAITEGLEQSFTLADGYTDTALTVIRRDGTL